LHSRSKFETQASINPHSLFTMKVTATLISLAFAASAFASPTPGGWDKNKDKGCGKWYEGGKPVRFSSTYRVVAVSKFQACIIAAFVNR
jgi:hypothetical protein